jgi:hypothetical protein
MHPIDKPYFAVLVVEAITAGMTTSNHQAIKSSS